MLKQKFTIELDIEVEGEVHKYTPDEIKERILSGFAPYSRDDSDYRPVVKVEIKEVP